VNRSTGFATPKPLPGLVDPHLLQLQDQALPLYQLLARHALG
jgi:hypothetical protein